MSLSCYMTVWHWHTRNRGTSIKGCIRHNHILISLKAQLCYENLVPMLRKTPLLYKHSQSTPPRSQTFLLRFINLIKVDIKRHRVKKSISQQLFNTLNAATSGNPHSQQKLLLSTYASQDENHNAIKLDCSFITFDFHKLTILKHFYPL